MPVAVDQKLVERLVSNLSACVRKGWRAEMGSYGFVAVHSPVGYRVSSIHCCCFFGASLLEHWSLSGRTDVRTKLPVSIGQLVCNLLGVSIEFLLGFNQAIIALEDVPFFRSVPGAASIEFQRGEAHAEAVWKLWQKTKNQIFDTGE